MENPVRELRVAIRTLLRRPGMVLSAVVALGLGIGLTAFVFSLVWGTLVRGLPFPEGDRLVRLRGASLERPGERTGGIHLQDFLEWSERQRSLEATAAFTTATLNLSGTEAPQRYDGALMSGNTLEVLRVQPAIGRGFTEADDRPGAPLVVLLGYDVWRNRYAGDVGVLGRAVRLNGEPATIVGVMPDGFGFPFSQEMWVPLRADPARTPRDVDTPGSSLGIVGRLRPGVSAEQAAREWAALALQTAREHPETNRDRGLELGPYTIVSLGSGTGPLLSTMLGAAFLVLLVACANVANLLIGWGTRRSREVGVRAALGATRADIIRQFLLETLVIAGMGALLGLGVANAAMRWFVRSVADTSPPFWLEAGLQLDPAMLAFVLAVMLVVTLIAGIFPALQASRVDVGEVIKDAGRGTSSFRLGRASRTLVVLEIAFSCALLVAAGLMVRSIINLGRFDLGFTTDDVFTARLGLDETRYAEAAEQTRFWTALEERISALPGSEGAALTSALPGAGANRTTIAVEGEPDPDPERSPAAYEVITSPGFFRVLGTGAVEGRLFGTTDRDGSVRVAVVNQSFARKHFGGEDPIGKQLWLGKDRDRQVTVVGVVPDLHAGLLNDTDSEAMYLPLAQNPQRFMSIAVRAAGDPLALTGPVRSAVRALDADLPIYFVRSLEEEIAENYWSFRVFGAVFTAFGIAALFLASVGLYAVVSFAVKQRTRELGIRIALGAQVRTVVALVMRQGAVQIAIGTALGLLLGFGISRLLGDLLFDVSAADPATFATVALVLAAVALLASYLPARRAARVDPMVALRTE